MTGKPSRAILRAVGQHEARSSYACHGSIRLSSERGSSSRLKTHQTTYFEVYVARTTLGIGRTAGQMRCSRQARSEGAHAHQKWLHPRRPRLTDQPCQHSQHNKGNALFARVDADGTNQQVRISSAWRGQSNDNQQQQQPDCQQHRFRAARLLHYSESRAWRLA